MNRLSQQIKDELVQMGAAMVGFADLSDLPEAQTQGYNYGVAIAVALDPNVINGIANGPTKEYKNEFDRVNSLLNMMDERAAELLKAADYNAFPMTQSKVKIDYSNRSTVLPHKTVATKAGLGWIGKCALLVTEKYGTAVRVSAVLTDAPLETAEPITQSRCGGCDSCVRNCPGQAASGALWHAGANREEFFDYQACRKQTVERSWNIWPGYTLCGLCVLSCTRTQQYIKAAGLDYNFPAVDIALKGDLEEILALQKLAYQSEAEIYDDYTIQPLTQTLQQLKEEAKTSVILKIVEDRKIVGSVRGYEKAGVLYIGKVIVNPDYQNRGLGKKLLAAMEKCSEHVRYELFTGSKSVKNLSFYQKQGYKIYKSEKVNDKFELVYLEKYGH